MAFDYFYPEQAEQFAFFRIPKILFKDKRFKNISTDAKVLYGLMLDRVSLSVRNQWIDDRGRVYIIFTLEEIMEELDCANQKATKLISELEDKAHLIERKRQGLGKPALIYVKNFSCELREDEITEKQPFVQSHENHDSQTHDFHESRLMISMNPDSRKSHANNTNKNKTEFNHTDPILSSGLDKPETEWKGTESRSEIKDLFEKNLQAEELRKGRPKDAGLINEIIELLVDASCSRQKRIRIARDDKPADDVREKLLMLDASHIEYVLTCMAQNTTQITNIRQYLLAALYNAPMTIENYYSSQAQHDIAVGKI
ncbi:MAG: replication initiator protein A [Firmicutes bacterium]|nr:replication initiator protein A [Bacillota bacterium]